MNTPSDYWPMLDKMRLNELIVKEITRKHTCEIVLHWFFKCDNLPISVMTFVVSVSSFPNISIWPTFDMLVEIVNQILCSRLTPIDGQYVNIIPVISWHYLASGSFLVTIATWPRRTWSLNGCGSFFKDDAGIQQQLRLHRELLGTVSVFNFLHGNNLNSVIFLHFRLITGLWDWFGGKHVSKLDEDISTLHSHNT